MVHRVDGLLSKLDKIKDDAIKMQNETKSKEIFFAPPRLAKNSENDEESETSESDQIYQFGVYKNSTRRSHMALSTAIDDKTTEEKPLTKLAKSCGINLLNRNRNN